MIFLTTLLVHFVLTGCFGYQVCNYRLPECEGDELDCYRSLPCYNGLCDIDGKCICFNCWTENQCNQYVDNYEPKFLFSTRHVVLSTLEEGVVFTVSANDDDLINTCHLESDCLCARPYYNIREAPAAHPFIIDHLSGEVRVSEDGRLEAIESMTLLISVQRSQNDSWDRNSVNSLTVFITVYDNFENEADRTNDETVSDFENHLRHKRASGANANITNINLNQLHPVYTNYVEPGDKFDFQLDIQVASGATTDLHVEIFSLEHITNNSVFALVNVNVKSVGTGLTTSLTTNSQPELAYCDDMPDISYRATFDMESVVADTGDTNISIVFSAIFLDIAPYVVNGSNYSIFAGVSYESDALVWIGQVSFEAVIPATKVYPSFMSITNGPETLAIDGYAVFTANVYTVSPNDTYQLDIFGFGAPVDSYSTGSIVMTSVNVNYPLIRSNWLSYPYQQFPSNSENTTMKTELFISSLINTDEQRITAETDDNRLSFEFVVYALNNENLVDTVLSMACTLMIGGNTIWTNLINMTLTARVATPQLAPSSMSLRNNTIIVGGVGRTARAYVDIVIPEATHSDISLELSVTNSDAITVCGVTTENGVNIPYVPPVTPVINDTTSKISINFGRIWNAQLVELNTTANTMTVIIIIRAESVAADNQAITILQSGVPDLTFTISLQGTASLVESDLSVVDVSMIDIFNQTNLTPGEETAIKLTLNFPLETTFGNLMLEIAVNMANETVKGRICAATVVNVGSKIPCMNKRVINSGIQYNNTDGSGDFDTALINLGGVCIPSATSSNSSNTNVDVLVSFEVPLQVAAIPGSYFRLYSGMSLAASSTIWASSFAYNMAATSISTMPSNGKPEIFVYVAPNSPSLMANNVAIVNIHIKIPPLSRSNYSLQMTGGVCSFSVVSVGASFPCVQNEVLQSSFIYEDYNSDSGSYSNALLNFGWLANLVSTPWLSDNSIDDNSIIIAAAVKPFQPIIVSLTYTGTLVNTSLSLDNSTSTPSLDPLANTINVTLFALDDSNTISTTTTKIVALQMQFSSNFLSNVTLSFENSNALSNEYAFCSAAVTTVGANIPCFNATKFNPTFNPALENLNCSNSITLDLGSICRLPLCQNQSSDSITVEASVMLLDPSLSSITISATVITSDGFTISDDLQLRIDSSPVPTSTTNVTVLPDVSDSSLTLGVGQRAVLKFNVSIPSNNTVPLNITVTTPAMNNRATMTISRLVLLVAGINVACVKNSSDAILDSEGISTPQNNLATLNLGYVTNTGLSERRGNSQPYDSHLSFEVDILMGDHPDQANGAVQMVIFRVAGEVEGNQSVILQRNGTERPDIKATVSVTNQRLFRKNDLVEVRLLLLHSLTSAAEPSTTYIRLFLPIYLNFTGTPTSNATVDVQFSPVITLEINTPFYFEQVFDVNFTLLVDPYDKRGPGAEMINTTSIGMIMVDSKVPGKSFAYAGSGFYVTFGIIGQGCFDALGMESGFIRNCQLSSSTSVDSNFGPDMARMGGASGVVWKPALRSSSYPDYLQVDFGNKSRVAKVEFEKDLCCRAPASVLIQGSDNSFNWQHVYQSSSLNYSNGNVASVELPNSFEGRFMRLVILEGDEIENKDSKYIGVRVEFYGCPLESDIVINVCNINNKTLFSNDVNQYRHISVDTKHNAVYACDLLGSTLTLGCFCSNDGVTWTVIPLSSVTIIAGLDSTSGFTYGHRGVNSTVYKSENCLQWLTVTESEFDNIMSSPDFIESRALGGYPRSHPDLSISAGSWTTDYDGISFDNNIRLSWS